MLVCFLITVGGVTAMLLAMAKGIAILPGIVKMIASTGFMGLAVAAGGLQTTYGRMILVALFFSWWGDLFLISGQRHLFLMGLVAFFLGHLGFGAAFLAHGVNTTWTLAALVALLIPLGVVIRWLHPSLGEMRYPVYAYIGIITLMVALSAGAWGKEGTVLMLVGAVLFYISDVFVARDRFVTSDVWNRYLGLPLYYAAQLALAYTVRLVS